MFYYQYFTQEKLTQNGYGGSAGPTEPVEIYGPEGIRDMVRAVVQLSYSMVVPVHRIHELKNIPKPKGEFLIDGFFCVSMIVTMC